MIDLDPDGCRNFILIALIVPGPSKQHPIGRLTAMLRTMVEAVFLPVSTIGIYGIKILTHKLWGGVAFYNTMHKRMKFNHDKDNDALGLVFGTYKDEEIIWYAGGDIGFNSYVMLFPKKQTTIVCFSNLDIGGNAEKMVHA